MRCYAAGPDERNPTVTTTLSARIAALLAAILTGSTVKEW